MFGVEILDVLIGLITIYLAFAVACTKAEAALASATETLNAAKLPLGWSEATLPNGLDWVTKVFGLLLSTFAISLGSPFWFSVLEKFKAIRASGTQEKTTKEEREAAQKP